MVRDGEAWHAAVHGVTKSRTQLGDWTKTTAAVATEHNSAKCHQPWTRQERKNKKGRKEGKREGRKYFSFLGGGDGGNITQEIACKGVGRVERRKKGHKEWTECRTDTQGSEAASAPGWTLGACVCWCIIGQLLLLVWSPERCCLSLGAGHRNHSTTHCSAAIGNNFQQLPQCCRQKQEASLLPLPSNLQPLPSMGSYYTNSPFQEAQQL